MSYFTPGPQRRDLFDDLRRKQAEETSVVARARQEAERLDARPAKPPEKPVAGVVGDRRVRPEEMTSPAGPPALDHLLEHEETRAAARAVGDTRLAGRALREVVGDLDNLLTNAEAQLRLSARGRSRQTVKEAMPQLVAMSSLAALPLDEVADILDLPSENVDTVVASLVRHGGLSPGERHAALKGVEQLRTQLWQAEAAQDHGLLDRLLRFIVKIAVLVGVAVGAAPVAALAVGEPVIKEVVKAGIVALVAMTLQRTADAVRDRRPDPYVAARAEHAALLEELAAARCLDDQPAYEGEHTVVGIRLAVRCGTARIASITIDWKEKQQYWAVLDEITDAVGQHAPPALARLQRTLRALTPPSRRQD
ncbi:hypothetical protein SAMN05216266_11057 [Amycolatopsis marina]|uniref:Uncharacterized protein n=1 Tax=Amycolatopsis marina TaxID=490629 RepID=A0A1I1AQC3_9PSEU|nr:hypothetical protein [Amycolatopsis marina]SFB40224.1 hypothetical protein SAMN05216266_11057 [Amycolatopsis marina]